MILKNYILPVFTLLFFQFSTFAYGDEITDDQLLTLVSKVCSQLESGDPQVVYEAIMNSEHPYKNKDNPALYAFVYDSDVTIVAHPKKKLVGRNYKGKPDVRGKKFRDAIVNKAFSENEGWEDYHYQKPGDKGIHEKTAYFRKCATSTGSEVVVVSGKYK
jgi:polar amino acid transport system substrate-binding protein